ncbi:hypothetical protein TWF481_011796 [Arthrobotrys musiformis]|uniref:Uncharacterized protein n=1 Tax=Arthrobotrys musiformis TaxID=47236 RepID=A0AAV9VW86_9PEZI
MNRMTMDDQRSVNSKKSVDKPASPSAGVDPQAESWNDDRDSQRGWRGSESGSEDEEREARLPISVPISERDPPGTPNHMEYGRAEPTAARGERLTEQMKMFDKHFESEPSELGRAAPEALKNCKSQVIQFNEEADATVQKPV